jgi:hypothetical protein
VPAFRRRENVAFRVVCVNRVPDHATIARFRARNQEAPGGLFGQVLGLCAEARLVRAGVIAVDGSKFRAGPPTRRSAAGRTADATGQDLREWPAGVSRSREGVAQSRCEARTAAVPRNRSSEALRPEHAARPARSTPSDCSATPCC